MSTGWLSIETRDSWTWTGQFTVGANTRTYTNDAGDNSAYDAMVAMLAWLNAAARPWFGAITFAWSVAQATGGGAFTLTATANFTLVASAGMTTATGLPSAAATQTIAGTVASGTIWPDSGVKLRQYLRQLPAGSGAAVGSFLGAVPGLAPYRPRVQAIGSRSDAARWHEQLANAASPRRGWVYQDDVGVYRQVALGQEKIDRADARNAYNLHLEAAGEAI